MGKEKWSSSFKEKVFESVLSCIIVRLSEESNSEDSRLHFSSSFSFSVRWHFKSSAVCTVDNITLESETYWRLSGLVSICPWANDPIHQTFPSNDFLSLHVSLFVQHVNHPSSQYVCLSVHPSSRLFSPLPRFAVESPSLTFLSGPIQQLMHVTNER